MNPNIGWQLYHHPLDFSPLEVKQKNKMKLDITTKAKFSHYTHTCPQNPIFFPKFPQQCKCYLPNIDDMIVSLQNSKSTIKHAI
jgi:hypothetical protein